MVARSRARYLAPLALAATITATYLIVDGQPASNHSTPSAHLGRDRPQHGPFAKAKFYVVQSGDSLSQISLRTGIAVATLETLNHNVNPGALQTGQRLRLRR
jgi:nucleoid-associated protein YgaU